MSQTKRPILVIPLYRFSELSAKAKDKVRKRFAEEVESHEIECVLQERINDHYPWMAELRLAFSLGYSQGDGVCVEGKLRGELLHEHLPQLAHLLLFLPKDENLVIAPTHHRHIVQGAVKPEDGCDCPQIEQLCVELTKLVKAADADLASLGYAFVEHCSSDEYIEEWDEYWYTNKGERHRIEGVNHADE